MRLVRFDNNRAGALVDGPTGPMVIDLLELSGDGSAGEARQALSHALAGSWSPLIERWGELGPALAALVGSAGSEPDGRAVRRLDEVRLRAPLPSPVGRIFALGVNFRSHVASASQAVGTADPTKDDTRPPAGFFVIPGSVIGPDDEIDTPADAQRLDYEAEVAAVLASGGRYLGPEDVRFWGHTAFNDVSIRDPHLGLSRLDEGALAWGLQKNFDGGNIVGPWLAVDEGYDLAALTIRSRVNGELRQDGSTAQMITSFAVGAAYISRYLTLQPGDMLTSGTPGGTAIEQGPDGQYLQPGDLIEVEVQGAGVLRNRVVSPRTTN